MQLIKSPAKNIKDQAVIYEVNLTIANDVIDEFDAWLQKHIEEMLAISGFKSASTSVIENYDEDTKQRCVQYRLVNQAALYTYFENDAERMRADGLKKFSGKMTAERRILTPSQAVLSDSAICANCGTQLEGRFCSSCGQREEPRVPTVLNLLKEASNALFGLESKLWKSIYILLFRPGQLSVEYLIGKRQKYTSPFRLYLLISIFAFAYFSVIGNKMIDDINPNSTVDFEVGIAEESMVIAWGILPTKIENFINENVLKTVSEIEGDLKNGNYKKIFNEVLQPLPKALLLFLPFIAIVFKIVYLGSGKHYAEHLVYLLHNHAFLFIVLIFTVYLQQVIKERFLLDYCLGLATFFLLSYGFLRPRVIKYFSQFKTKYFRVIFKSIFWLLMYIALFQLFIEDGLLAMLISFWIFFVPYYLYRSMRVVYSRGRYMTIVSYFIIFISYFMLWSLMLVFTAAYTGFNY